jgi:cyclopropane fatty-acyl-phospholipid synthase-like methyltransferase
VLDVGCGDGDIRPLLGDVDYTGVDLNTDYLRVASASADERTRFVHADVSALGGLGLGPFDCAIAVGLLHHLSDSECDSLLAAVHDTLAPGGRLVTIDPVFTPDQRTTARVLAALDRGRHVREVSGYTRLIDQQFEVKESVVRQDLLPFPYSHALIEAVRP